MLLENSICKNFRPRNENRASASSATPGILARTVTIHRPDAPFVRDAESTLW